MSRFASISALVVLATGIVASAQEASPPPSIQTPAAVDSFLGSFGTTVQLDLPTYFRLEPSIAAVYSTSNGNSSLGIGWGLTGGSRIVRLGPDGSIARFDSTDEFSIDGQELVACTDLGGTHCTKIQNFTRITQTGPNWHVFSKRGTRYLYEPLIVGSSGTHAWALTEVRDTSDRVASYQYFCDEECFLSSVNYGIYEVEIHWELRPDPSRYTNGDSLITSKYRVASVVVRAEDEISRAYGFNYDLSASSARSVLLSIVQYGRDAILDSNGRVVGGSALPAGTYEMKPGVELTTEDFHHSDHIWVEGMGDYTFDEAPGEAITEYPRYIPSWVADDFNGDGLVDYAAISIQDLDSSFFTYLESLIGWVAYEGLNTSWQDFLMYIANPDGTYTEYSERILEYECGPVIGVPGQTTSSCAVPQHRALVGDVEPDGTPEWISLRGTSGSNATIEIRRWTGSGYSVAAFPIPASADLDLPADWYEDLEFLGGDFNADGRADLALIYPRDETIWVTTFRSLGDDTFAVESITTPWEWDDDESWIATDVDGDSRTDILGAQHAETGNGTVIRTLRSLESGGFAQASFSPASLQWKDSTRWLAADVNGDGRGDLVAVRKHGATDRVWIESFETRNVGEMVQSSFNTHWAWRGQGQWLVADLNADRRADLVQAFKPLSGLYTHLRFASGLGDGTFELSTRSTSIAYPTLLENIDTWERYHQWFAADVNADSVPDLVGVWGRYTAGGVRAEVNRIDSIGPPDLMDTVWNGLGAETTIEYESSKAWNNQYLPLGFTVPTVASITVSDGREDSSTTEYTYEGGLWSLEERRFLGFRRSTNTISATGAYSETIYHQHEGCIAKPEETSIRDNTDAILTRTVYEYDQVDDGTPPYISFLESRWDYQCNLTATCRTILTQFDYDSYGNPTTTYEYGDYHASGDERTSVIAYTNNAADYIVALPSIIGAWEGIGTVGELAELIRYGYDDLPPFEPPIAGNETLREAFDDATGGTASFATTWENGLSTSQTAPDGEFETLSYDATGTFEETLCNNLSHCSTKLWDRVIGQMTTSIGVNGETTSFHYDDFGRLVQKVNADGTVHSLEYLDMGDPTLQRIRETQEDGTADGLWTETYFDGLGRPYRIEKEGGLVRQERYVETSDKLKELDLWHFSSDTPSTETREYDAVGRLVKIINPDGSFAEIVYMTHGRVLIDELGTPKAALLDGLGRTTRVTELFSGPTSSVHHTYYQYDARDNLVEVTDAKGNLWTADWSTLGQKTQMCDPDSGCYVYEYSMGGKLEFQVDPRGVETTLTYDPVGRISQRSVSGVVVASFLYDQSGHGASVGRLTRVEYAGGWEEHTYDELGLETRNLRCTSGACHEIEQEYDELGRLKSIEYPDGEVVAYSYDDSGRLDSVGGYVDDMTWNARGQLLSASFSNGTTTTFDVDEARGWTNEVNVSVGAETLFEASYLWDEAGRVEAVTSQTNPLLNLAFGYDEISRLTSVSGALAESFSYDEIGNRTSSPLGAIYYNDPSHVHAATSAGDLRYSYDANGNMTLVERDIAGTLYEERTLTWDDQNNLLVISGPTEGAQQYWYNHEGKRIGEVDYATGTSRMYFGPLVEQKWTYATGTQLIKNYYAGGMLVARRAPGSVRWFHPDQLESVRLVTNETGDVVNRVDYSPLGVRAAGALEAGSGFGGHEDLISGLVNMGSRYYDPVLGAFVSPDSIVPAAFEPQALNRYAYAYNNPVSNVDPNGHAPVAAAWVTWGIIVASGGSTTAIVVATVGALAVTAGFYFNDPVLLSIGQVLTGAAYGYTFTPLGTPPLQNAAQHALVAYASSPASPLDNKIKVAIAFSPLAQTRSPLGCKPNDAICNFGVILWDRFRRSAAREAIEGGFLEANSEPVADLRFLTASRSQAAGLTTEVVGRSMEKVDQTLGAIGCSPSMSSSYVFGRLDTWPRYEDHSRMTVAGELAAELGHGSLTIRMIDPRAGDGRGVRLPIGLTPYAAHRLSHSGSGWFQNARRLGDEMCVDSTPLGARGAPFSRSSIGEAVQTTSDLPLEVQAAGRPQ